MHDGEHQLVKVSQRIRLSSVHMTCLKKNELVEEYAFPHARNSSTNHYHQSPEHAALAPCFKDEGVGGGVVAPAPIEGVISSGEEM